MSDITDIENTSIDTIPTTITKKPMKNLCFSQREFEKFVVHTDDTHDSDMGMEILKYLHDNKCKVLSKCEVLKLFIN